MVIRASLSTYERGVKWARRAGILFAVYLVCDMAYVWKSADGIDLLPAGYGHHGWMFIGSDWAIARLKPLLHHERRL